MDTEITTLFQKLITIPGDLLRLYPNDKNLHDIANSMLDKLNSLQVMVIKTDSEYSNRIKQLEDELKSLKK